MLDQVNLFKVFNDSVSLLPFVLLFNIEHYIVVEDGPYEHKKYGAHKVGNEDGTFHSHEEFKPCPHFNIIPTIVIRVGLPRNKDEAE